MQDTDVEGGGGETFLLLKNVGARDLNACDNAAAAREGNN